MSNSGASMGRKLIEVLSGKGRVGRVASFSLFQATSQGVLLLAALAIARLLGPQAFGGYAIFLSQAAIVGGLLTMRYDALLSSAGSDGEAAEILLRFTRFCGFGIASAVPVIVVLSVLDVQDWHASVLVLACGGATAVSTVAAAYVINHGRPLAAILPRLMFALSLFPLQYLSLKVGLDNPAVLGHVICAVLAGGLAILMILKGGPHRALSGRRVTKGSAHPRYIAAGIANQFANNLPVPVIAMIYGDLYAGYFALAQRVLGAPIMLFGNALSTALAAEVGRHGAPTVRSFGYFVLAGIGFGFLAILMTQGQLIALINPDWAGAAWIVAALIPVYAARVVAIPAVAEVSAARDGGFMLALELCRLASFASIVVCFASSRPGEFMAGFSTVFTGFYLILALRGLALSLRRVRCIE